MHRFISHMILRNTVSAALQRASVYEEGVDSKLKKEFKIMAKNWLLDFGKRYQRSTIDRTQWCNELKSLSDMLNNEFEPYLRDGEVKLGICQKMVSLYLKYIWLITGEEDKRPLFAVIDRGVMKSASVSNAPNWTHLKEESEYLRVVNQIDEFARRSGFTDGAHWEAEEWLGMNDDE